MGRDTVVLEPHGRVAYLPSLDTDAYFRREETLPTTCPYPKLQLLDLSYKP